MLKIRGRKTSINVQKVLLCVETLGLAYERVDAGLEFGVVDTPAYRRLNPNGKVPTIEDEGFELWESNSIIRYLCAKHAAGRLYPDDLHRRADLERWMDWQLATLNGPIGSLFWGLVRKPGSRPVEEIDAARIKAGAVMGLLDARLSDRPFISGPNLGMADFTIAPFVHRWINIPMERVPLPRLEGYYGRLMEFKAPRTVLELPMV